MLDALSNLKWLVVMDPLPTTSSEFWHAPGRDPSKIDTEVFCENGAFTFHGNTLHDHKPLGSISVRDAGRPIARLEFDAANYA